MEVIKLLLVEDDESLSFMLKGSLELTGDYEVYTATNGKEGLEIYKKTHPTVLVADVEMPEMSGFEMVRQIRETDTHTPIIFASARKSPKDLIEGLYIGADNFIRKPYLPEELNFQIIALLRRVKGVRSPYAENKNRYTFGNYQIDIQSRSLLLRNDENNPLALTEREMNILKILLEKKGELVTREEILVPLWGDNNFYTARSLDVFMTKIRKYLKEDDSAEIQTIRGGGYRLIADSASKQG